MEQVPQSNEPNEQQQPQPERPVLFIDLNSTQHNPLSLMLRTRELLGDDEWEAFGQEIQEADTPGANKDYHYLLAIIDSHVELVDISETHPVYGDTERVAQATQRYQQRVIAAVDRLNEQLMTLPESRV